MVGLQLRDGLIPVRGEFHLVSLRVQHATHQGADLPIILGHQDPRSSHARILTVHTILCSTPCAKLIDPV